MIQPPEIDTYTYEYISDVYIEHVYMYIHVHLKCICQNQVHDTAPRNRYIHF